MCEKRRFHSLRRARRVAYRIEALHGFTLRVYRCPQCNCYHHTSTELDHHDQRSAAAAPRPRYRRPGNHRRRRGRRLQPGESLEEVAREMREARA